MLNAWVEKQPSNLIRYSRDDWSLSSNARRKNESHEVNGSGKRDKEQLLRE